MSAAELTPASLLPRQNSRLGLGAALALLAHGGLIAALAVGLNWRLPVPDSVMSAEIWSAVPQQAAPAPTAPPPPPPAPAPAPAPAPTPAPAPAPRLAPPPPPPPNVAQREAEIALEKAAAQRKRAQEEEAALKQKQKLEQQRLAEQNAQKAAKLKQEQQAREEQARADKQRADKARELQRQQELSKQREADAKAAAEAEREDKLQEEAVAKQREANLKRMMGQAGATGAPQATGSAARDSGPSAAYAGRIKARIKPNIVLLSEVSGNPVAEVEVRSAPDGSIVGRRIVKPSGNAAWDETVLRAIDRTGSLPRDTDGRMPATLILVFPRQE